MPEKSRFYWQTRNPYISSKEKELLISLLKVGIVESPLLEVGCGEGANLINLRSMGYKPVYCGVDFCLGKVKFASFQGSNNARFICGDAVSLPLKDRCFNVVLLRDLLHHVDNHREDVIREALRVCKESGYIFIIEGNGSKFTNRIFSSIISAEKGMRNSTKEKIERLLNLLQINKFYINMVEPFNLFRFFLHYRYGVSVLGKVRLVRMILDFVERVFAKVIPRDKWAYIIVEVRK